VFWQLFTLDTWTVRPLALSSSENMTHVIFVPCRASILEGLRVYLLRSSTASIRKSWKVQQRWTLHVSNDHATSLLDHRVLIAIYNTVVHAWSYRFTNLLSSAMGTGMGPKQPAYTTILQLDRQIRDFNVPMEWRPRVEQENPPPPLHIHLYRWLVLSNKETGT
jgi:hypothetical protein